MRVLLPSNAAFFPEISAGPHRFSVRFARWRGAAEYPRPVSEDVQLPARALLEACGRGVHERRDDRPVRLEASRRLGSCLDGNPAQRLALARLGLAAISANDPNVEAHAPVRV